MNPSLHRSAWHAVLSIGLAAWGAQALAQAALPDDVVDNVRRAFGAGELRTMSGRADLDGDGNPELLVYVVGPTTCGTGGCPLLVFASAARGWRLVSKIGPSQTPVGVAAPSSSGWRDLVVRIGGGGAKSADMALSFDGKSYPANPTVRGPRVKPAAKSGQTVIAEQKAFDDAQPLPVPVQGLRTSEGASAAPSFDCAKATAPVEKLICGDAQLAVLDREVAHAYAKALSSQWSEADKAAVRGAQRTWIGERNACVKVADAGACIADGYLRRLVELKIALGDVGVVPKPVAYRCHGAEDMPVFATFYNELEPRATVVKVGGKQVVAFATPSGSGARYVAHGVELWDHHGEATLRWFAKSYACKAN